MTFGPCRGGTRRWHGPHMLITMDRSGGYEDLLRSLGAVLDERGARTIIVRDIPAGLMVRALMTGEGAGDRPGTLVPIERVFPSPTLLEAQVNAVLRRGSDHVAGPIERALRVVGRRIDSQGLREATAIQGAPDGQWSVWHHRITDGQLEAITLTADDIEGFGLAGPLDRGLSESQR
jgi:hypothetical protein